MHFLTISTILLLGAMEVQAFNMPSCPVWLGKNCKFRKRDGAEIFGRDPSVVELKRDGDLVKRGSSVVGTDTTATTYLVPTLPPWAILPGSSCGWSYTSNAIVTTAICPYGYKCRCQPGGSKCIDNIAPDACTEYVPTTTYDICDIRWTTTITDYASAFGQCGGFADSSVIAGSAWTAATMCPENYGCACRNFWYSQCLPTSAYSTDCPPASLYWGCPTSIPINNSGAYRQCGGICWDILGSSKGCDNNWSCWTKTENGYEAPGAYAMCAPSRPDAPQTQYQEYAESLCYPVPYRWTKADRPVCAGQQAAVATPAPSSATLWGQCGGGNYHGPSQCPDGLNCIPQNPYYSQCQPPAKKVKKSATPVENPAAVVTPVKRVTQRDITGPARPGARVRFWA